VFDWLKDRARLVAEVREAREQAALYAAMNRTALKDRDQAWNDRDAARESLDAVTGQREKAWARIEGLRHEKAALAAGADPLDSPPAHRTAAAELLAERARADQLAELVTRLQEANMRAGCEHGIPLVEVGARA
jgi:hypothetical protein